jgi:hypothetical protein
MLPENKCQYIDDDKQIIDYRYSFPVSVIITYWKEHVCVYFCYANAVPLYRLPAQEAGIRENKLPAHRCTATEVQCHCRHSETISVTGTRVQIQVTNCVLKPHNGKQAIYIFPAR